MKAIDEKDLFGDDGALGDVIDNLGEEVIHIDTDEIDKDADSYAHDLIKTVAGAYYDEDFLNENPSLAKRIKSSIDALRLLMKMRKSSETIHDLAVKAVGGNSGNASLYRAVTDTQKSVIAIQTKIDEEMDRLNNLLKNYQMEFEFKEGDGDSSEDDDSDDDLTTRGSKEFIEKMKGNNR